MENNMTKQELKRIQKDLDENYAFFEAILSDRALTILHETVYLEMLLEAECGQ
jgi:hypothetical protein